MDPELPLLVWDGDCSFCARCVRVTHSMQIAAEVLPWQVLDLSSLGLTEEDCRRAVQWVPMDGPPASGGRAVASALSAGGMPWRLLGRLATLPGLRSVVDAAYRVIAANRHRLPGSTASCEVRSR